MFDPRQVYKPLEELTKENERLVRENQKLTSDNQILSFTADAFINAFDEWHEAKTGSSAIRSFVADKVFYDKAIKAIGAKKQAMPPVTYIVKGIPVESLGT